MAKNDTPPADAPAPAPVKVRVLSACVYGQANDVAEIADPALLADAKAAGLVDDNADAVAYAESLKA